jgi:glycosyltransferase involved in cell wall biosynthesis
MLPLFQADASIHLWFAGLSEDENYTNQLRVAIKEAGLSDRAIMLGSRNDVPALLAAADVFLMPSLEEAQGMAMLEALASGVPIVASDIPAFRFAAILPSVTLVQPDEASLRLGIVSAIHQARARRDLQEYDIALTAERYIDCARSLVCDGHLGHEV